jgi:hemoglobin
MQLQHPAADLTSRADIERLVDAFYERIRADALLGPIFDDVARVDWAAHLPRMYAFWDAVLFGRPGFSGNPLAVHMALNQRVPLGAAEFGRWLSLFHETVDALFAGAGAEDAKRRATRIASVMRHHLSGGHAA